MYNSVFQCQFLLKLNGQYSLVGLSRASDHLSCASAHDMRVVSHRCKGSTYHRCLWLIINGFSIPVLKKISNADLHIQQCFAILRMIYFKRLIFIPQKNSLQDVMTFKCYSMGIRLSEPSLYCLQGNGSYLTFELETDRLFVNFWEPHLHVFTVLDPHSRYYSHINGKKWSLT